MKLWLAQLPAPQTFYPLLRKDAAHPLIHPELILREFVIYPNKL